tara:strand:- start:124 stop:900 length:777 start_codon:yes stop_codon:yes gene_type:complete
MIDTILIAMGGEGKRFADEGFKNPKPFIKVDNEEMFIKATKCLPNSNNYIFITKKEFESKFNVKEIINKKFINNNLILMDGPTDGQVSTCLLANEHIPLHNSLLISPCDSSVIFDKKKLNRLIKHNDFDAIIWTFRNNATVARNPQMYGWVKTKDGQIANEVSCKKSISANPVKDHAIVGTFWFKEGKYFTDYANQLIKKNIRINNEFYVDEMINLLINDGLKVGIFEVEKYICWGTPNDLKTYEYWKKFFSEDYDKH